MSEAFFKAIKDFQQKYVTKEEKEQAIKNSRKLF